MTHTFTKRGKTERNGGFERVRGDLDITSYTAAGEVLTPSVFGMKRIDAVLVGGVSDNGHTMRQDTAGKMRAYKSGAAAGLITEVFPDVKGGVFATRASSGATALNGAAVIAAVTATTAAKSTILVQPNALDAEVAGRNGVVQIGSAAGGTLPADCGTATLVGTTPGGVAQTEVVSLAALNSVAITAGQFVYVAATKAFGTYTSLTLSVDLTASVADAEVSLGVGTIFGLRGGITAESDVKSVTKGTAAIAAATYVATASPSQIDMGADVADDVEITFVYDAVSSSLMDREAAASVDVGSTLVEVIGA